MATFLFTIFIMCLIALFLYFQQFNFINYITKFLQEYAKKYNAEWDEFWAITNKLMLELEQYENDDLESEDAIILKDKFEAHVDAYEKEIKKQEELWNTFLTVKRKYKFKCLYSDEYKNELKVE